MWVGEYGLPPVRAYSPRRLTPLRQFTPPAVIQRVLRQADAS